MIRPGAINVLDLGPERGTRRRRILDLLDSMEEGALDKVEKELPVILGLQAKRRRRRSKAVALPVPVAPAGIETLTNESLAAFSNDKPLVPGSKGGAMKFWRQERQIQALKEDMNELGKVLARLSQELIEQIFWFNTPPAERVNQQRRISQIMGALKRETSLLNGLMAAGFDLHPVISDLLLRRASQEFDAACKDPEPDEGLAITIAPETPVLIDSPNRSPNWRFLHSLTDAELELLVTLAEEPQRLAKLAERLNRSECSVGKLLQQIRAKWRAVSGKEIENDATNP